MACLQPPQQPSPRLEYEHQKLDFGDEMWPSTPGAAPGPGQHPQLPGRAGLRQTGGSAPLPVPCGSTSSRWVRLPWAQVGAVPGRRFLIAFGVGGRQGEEGELWAATDESQISKSTGRAGRGEAWALLCPPRGCGGTPASPLPTGRAQPPWPR